jgi:threonylcarbamoyladenosine tRNA methylthiotransferase MtaB
MNRPYTTSFFREITEKLAAAVPGVFIGTDIIAGFPGETDEDFRQGYRFLEPLPLAAFHVFPFSPRQGTPAASMPGQVPARAIKERAETLRRLSEEKKKRFFEGFIGKELDVLVQEEGKNGVMKGLSRNYIPVALPAGSAVLNHEVRVKITEAETDAVSGVIV